MKKDFLLFVLIFSCLVTKAQQYETVSFKAGDDVNSKKDYLFESFSDGVVKFKAGGMLSYKMNFNKLTAQMDFINPAGDTLSISKPDEIQSIQIENSLFYYNKGYTEIFADNDTFKLAAKRKVSLETVKIGAMGVRSRANSIDSYDNLIVETGTRRLELNQDIDVNKVTTYLLVLANGEELIANKSNFIKVFKPLKNNIEDFIKQQKINFYKKDDLKKLFSYCVQS